jgi:hypothetical protein
MSCSVTVWDSGRSVTILDCEIAPLFGRKGTERGGGVRNGSKIRATELLEVAYAKDALTATLSAIVPRSAQFLPK